MKKEQIMNKSVMPIQVSGRAGHVDLVAGVLCLDFVNTLDPRVVTQDGTIPRNYLTAYGELIAWGQHVDVLTPSQAQDLLKAAEEHPDQSQAALDHALKLRETIYKIFFAISQHREVPAKALESLKNIYAQATQLGQFASTEEGFALIWTHDGTDLHSPLWPVTASAVELLLRGDQQRMKECPSASEGCGWLFYDTSKNNSRRWCSMRTCGMESKDRRRGKRKLSSPPGK
jgi:predicted RNA-binding Zn ribbon-like protein